MLDDVSVFSRTNEVIKIHKYKIIREIINKRKYKRIYSF